MFKKSLLGERGCVVACVSVKILDDVGGNGTQVSALFQLGDQSCQRGGIGLRAGNIVIDIIYFFFIAHPLQTGLAVRGGNQLTGQLVRQ
ncbi:hypothetical protein D3C79_601790 [compost metagenome]